MDTPQESNLVKAYQEAYRLACARLSRCRPEEVCQNSKAFYDETTQTFVITYFNVTCRVSRDGGTVRLSDAPGEPTVTEKTLILHYLTQAQPRPLSGRGISFREVPGGGAIYYPAFQKRALDPLVKQFAERIPAFRKAAAALGGRPERYGTASATLYALPLVPITYVLWQGDAELPASGAILFDATVAAFLPTEDIVLAGSYGTYKLIGRLRTFSNETGG
jgi:hypothetical protein